MCLIIIGADYFMVSDQLEQKFKPYYYIALQYNKAKYRSVLYTYIATCISAIVYLGHVIVLRRGPAADHAILVATYVASCMCKGT